MKPRLVPDRSNDREGTGCTEKAARGPVVKRNRPIQLGALNLRPRRRATAKAKEKCDELKTTVYVMEAVELYEPKESNK